MKRKQIVLLPLLLGLSASLASASVFVVNLDFNQSGTSGGGTVINAGSQQTNVSGVGAAAYTGTTWNNIDVGDRWVGFNSSGQLANDATTASAPTAVTAHTLAGSTSTTRALTTSTGTVTSLNISMSMSTAPATGGSRFSLGDASANLAANVAGGASGGASVAPHTLMRDYLFFNGVTGRTINLTFNNLDTQAGVNGYMLYLYGAGDAVNQGGTWSVSGSGVTFNGGDNTTAQAVGTTLTFGEDYVVANFDASVGSRTISLSAPGVTGTAAFNGFQLVAIPEPSSALLLGLSALGFVGYRRRK